MKYGRVFLLIGACTFLLTALAHMSCIVLGPQCYSVQMAPPQIVESAESGTWLAPFSTVFVSSVFVLFGLYALSAAKLFKRLPLLIFVVYAISGLSIIRGLLSLQLWFRHPDKVSDIAFFVGVAWLTVGLLYLLGFRNVRLSSV